MQIQWNLKIFGRMKSISFETSLLKFGEKGEKTGWTYIHIAQDFAEALLPGNKKSFRVKGKIDAMPIKGVALIPMGDGSFIMPINADMRRLLKKKVGAMVVVSLLVDKQGYQLNEALIACLKDEPSAYDFFQSLPTGHRNYFSKWIDSAKTDTTKAKRIAMAVTALSKKMGYPDMIRFFKNKPL